VRVTKLKFENPFSSVYLRLKNKSEILEQKAEIRVKLRHEAIRFLCILDLAHIAVAD
jgi:hypothetical protein